MTYFTTGAQLQAAINALPTSKTGGFVSFDPFFYGQTYMSAYAGNLSPIEHFVQIGADRGYKPSASFDPTYYASKYADLTGKGLNAADLLYHFLQYGLDEGRAPNATLAGFDGAAYLVANPDVAAYVNANLAQFGGSANNGALAHYVKFGQFDGHLAPVAVGAVSTTLGVAQDTLTGSAGNDIFTAPIINNGNTLQSGDVITGGAGADRLNADVGTSQDFAITAESTGVETVAIRAQAVPRDSSNNNMQNNVQIDAQRMAGVTQWESSNSRADVVIEDVRIANSQITKDITIAMVETDPGHVDFGVYFDQYSLRSQPVSSASTVSFQLREGMAPATAPLDKLDVNGLTFVLTTPATGSTAASSKTVVLQSVAINDALTYEALVTAINDAIAVVPDAAGLVASLGPVFTTINGIPAVGNYVVITSNAGQTFTSPGFTNGPASTGAFTQLGNFVDVPPVVTADLVTSKIILDDVGRGSTGGDLVVGGLSVGSTSSSLGVQRFEIEVRDNSKLESISSTNNTLREVTIKNGVTSSSSFAYQTTVKDAGNLTVNGNSGTNGANVTNGRATDAQAGDNAALPGSAAQTANGFGFSDVRLIDASTMTGKLAFSAEMTSASIAKYLNLQDVQALPAGDNIAVTYTGGTNDDTLYVQLDQAAVSSRSTIVAGREDFTFAVNGGNGNDAITLNVVNGLAGGAQAWYSNQKLNANISVNGGDGNDTIRTPGAGDVKIDAGTGNDVVYTDNTGAQAVTARATGSAGSSALAYTNAAAAELSAALAAAVAANATDAAATAATAAGYGAGAAAVVAALNTLDALTANASAADLTAAAVVPVLPTHAAVITATQTAYAAGAITAAQKVAIDTAYNAYTTAPTVTAPITLNALSTFVGGVTNGAATLAAEVTNGDTVVAGILASARTALASAAAADTNTTAQNLLLDLAQALVVTSTQAMNAVDDLSTVPNEAGTATIVAGLSAVQSALSLNATDAAVVAALNTATASGAISAATAGTLFGFAVATPGTMDAAEVAAVTLVLSPLTNAAANANAAAQIALNNAIIANTAAQDVIAQAVAATPAGASATPDFSGTVGTAAAALAAAGLATTAASNLTAAQAKEAGLIALKGAITTTTPEYVVVNLLANAQAAGFITALENGVLTGFVGAAGVVTPVTALQKLTFDTGATGFLTAGSMDALISAAHTSVESLSVLSANAAATAAATATAASIATAASNSGGNSLVITPNTAVYVFDTANQAATYDRLAMDDRNLADLKSDANNSNNFFNSTVKVSYMGIDASVVVAGTGYKTTDLELNQAIKAAINNDPVLKALLVATDGPANTLVVTSLIDGVHTTADLAVTVTLPAASTIASSDVAAAAAVYGLPVGTTDAALLTAMTASKAAFDTKGDYATQFAESGANGTAANAVLVGANSVSSSDNTITGGTGNDVIVLGTTVGTDALTSSNEKVIFAPGFGNDTIVNFAISGLGIDTLDFTALNGRGNVALNSLVLDKSIVIAAETTANDTAAEIAALFTDSATAINHVYVAYNATNIGSVYMVADAAGATAGASNVTATLVGTIDLAGTGATWANVTAANFA